MVPPHSQFFIFFFLLLFPAGFRIPSAAAAADSSALVFKGCADQKFQDSNYKQTLNNLFDTLISQSASSKFNKATSGGGGGGGSAIDGLFQCRGDLSNDDCNRCVKRTPDLAGKLCGEAIAARVQLTGCYLRYEISGFRQVSGTELLYKICGSTRVSGAGFGDRLDLALGEVVKGVGSGSSGFYAGAYESVYVLGQCEGDLGTGDCVNCVKSAIDGAKSQCGSSISAQIFLQKCYISYNYYPSGVPSNEHSYSPSGTGRNTQKTIALVLGGLVGVGLVMACLLFAKSAFKKKTRTYKFGG